MEDEIFCGECYKMFDEDSGIEACNGEIYCSMSCVIEANFDISRDIESCGGSAGYVNGQMVYV